MRTKISKICLLCKKTFITDTGYAKQKYCSYQCSSKATSQTKKIVISEKILREAITTTDSYLTACEKLGIKFWTLYRRMREYGLRRPNKFKYYRIRPDGYIEIRRKGKVYLEHRYVWQRIYGEIPKDCHIHHKNGNKADNRIENLELMNGKAHNSFHSSQKGYKLCSIPTCRNLAAAKTFCPKHYTRWKKHGDPHFVTQQQYWPRKNKL